MKTLILAACLMSSCLTGVCLAVDPIEEAKSRLDEFLDYANAAPKKYSVAGRIARLVKLGDESFASTYSFLRDCFSIGEICGYRANEPQTRYEWKLTLLSFDVNCSKANGIVVASEAKETFGTIFAWVG